MTKRGKWLAKFKMQYFTCMFKRIIFIFIATLCFINALGQTDFCDAIATIMQDAPNKFRNVRGKMIEANANATFWESGVKVPYSISCRFVFSMGLFYEAAFLQSQNKEDVQPFYDACKKRLSDCLTPLGYKMTLTDNFYPGMQTFKKVIFTQETTADATPPAHITLEATYNKEVNKYTVVMYIFEH